MTCCQRFDETQDQVVFDYIPVQQKISTIMREAEISIEIQARSWRDIFFLNDLRGAYNKGVNIRIILYERSDETLQVVQSSNCKVAYHNTITNLPLGGFMVIVDDSILCNGDNGMLLVTYLDNIEHKIKHRFSYLWSLSKQTSVHI